MSCEGEHSRLRGEIDEVRFELVRRVEQLEREVRDLRQRLLVHVREHGV